MKHLFAHNPLLALVLPLLVCSAAPAQNYAITWSTVDAGGSMYTTGGIYTLGSTIGQHDAGPALTAAAASLIGGFWALDSTNPCPADFNHSGAVSVQDIFDFLAAYFGNEPPADFNHNGAVTVQDIFDFLAAYFAGCP